MTDRADAAESEIDWRWRRFQTWEYFATAAMLGGGFYLRFGAPHPDPDWKGGILFDDDIRERTAVQSVENRKLVTRMTDIAYFGSMGYRLVDSVFVPGVGWQNWDTALQMSMIDLEAFGFVAITLWGLQASFGRERPYVDRCGDPEFHANEGGCRKESEPNRSFYAGHPAVGMTAAGLTCTHHSYLPLYGGSGDALACGVTLGAAVMNGFGRVLSEKHYASDLAVGFGVGAFAGFVLPRVLHYAHPTRPVLARESEDHEPALAVRVIPVPMVGSDRLGMSLVGAF